MLALRYLSNEGVVRAVVIPGDTFTDSWWWRPEGHFLRAEVVADPVAGVQQMRLELGAVGVFSDDARYDEVLARPRIRALSNPVFVEDLKR